jgi:hypothetical protein
LTIDELLLVSLAKRRGGFEFKNERGIHDDVGNEVADHGSLVSHLEALLGIHRQTGLSQFKQERILVNGFQKARAEHAMNLHRAANDRFRKFFFQNPVNPANPVNPV